MKEERGQEDLSRSGAQRGNKAFLGDINLEALSVSGALQQSLGREQFDENIRGLVEASEVGKLSDVMDVLYSQLHERQRADSVGGDTDGSGGEDEGGYYIGVEDLADVLNIPYNDKTKGFLNQIADALDSDKNGKIDLREFLENTALLLGSDVDQKLTLLFNIYDVDGDGSLTHEEIEKMLSESLAINNLVISEERKEILINALFDMLDVDGDGEVNLKDFKKAMKDFSEPEKLGLAHGGRQAGEDPTDIAQGFLSGKRNQPYQIDEDSVELGSSSSSDFSDEEEHLQSIRIKREQLRQAAENLTENYYVSGKHQAYEVETDDSDSSESGEEGERTRAFKQKQKQFWDKNVVAGGNLDDASTPITDEIKNELKAYTKVAADFGTGGAGDPNANKPKWQRFLLESKTWSFKNWSLILWTFVLFVMNVLAYLSLFLYYSFGKPDTFDIFSWGGSIAKGFAGIMLLNCALILLSVSRGFITQLRRTALTHVFPFDENLRFHKAFATLILVAAFGHTCGHISNYVMVIRLDDDDAWDDAVEVNYWGRVPTWWEYILFFPVPTGIVAWAAMLAIFFTAHERVRHVNFELFWYTHHLFVLFYVSLLIHGAGQVLQFPVFWGCVLVPVLLYTIDRFMRVMRTLENTEVVGVTQHPNNVLELKIARPRWFFYRAGHYIFLNVPGISRFQWHPFTLTSTPLEKDWISVHVRTLGNWSKALYTHFHSNEKMKKREILFKAHRKRVNVDGPFGAPCEDILSYDVALMVGAGIGVTPFASVCRTIQLMQKKGILDDTTKRRYYFIWLNSNMACFEWFASLLTNVVLDVHPIVKLRTYMTRATNRLDLRSFMLWTALQAAYVKTGIDLLTGIPSQTQWGYPNWDEIFLHLRNKHQGKKIGVFFCGPARLANNLNWLCRQNDDPSTNTKFRFFQERF